MIQSHRRNCEIYSTVLIHSVPGVYLCVFKLLCCQVWLVSVSCWYSPKNSPLKSVPRFSWPIHTAQTAAWLVDVQLHYRELLFSRIQSL